MTYIPGTGWKILDKKSISAGKYKIDVSFNRVDCGGGQIRVINQWMYEQYTKHDDNYWILRLFTSFGPKCQGKGSKTIVTTPTKLYLIDGTGKGTTNWQITQLEKGVLWGKQELDVKPNQKKSITLGQVKQGSYKLYLFVSNDDQVSREFTIYINAEKHTGKANIYRATEMVIPFTGPATVRFAPGKAGVYERWWVTWVITESTKPVVDLWTAPNPVQHEPVKVYIRVYSPKNLTGLLLLSVNGQVRQTMRIDVPAKQTRTYETSITFSRQGKNTLCADVSQYRQLIAKKCIDVTVGKAPHYAFSVVHYKITRDGVSYLVENEGNSAKVLVWAVINGRVYGKHSVYIPAGKKEWVRIPYRFGGGEYKVCMNVEWFEGNAARSTGKCVVVKFGGERWYIIPVIAGVTAVLLAGGKHAD